MLQIASPEQFERQVAERLTRHSYTDVAAAADDVQRAVAEYESAVLQAEPLVREYRQWVAPIYPANLLPLVHLLEQYVPIPSHGQRERYPIRDWARIARQNRSLATQIMRQIERVSANSD